MENQPGHPDQLGMADQGFRPFTSLFLSTPSMAQQHAGSSVKAASIQMPTQPSHLESGTICPTSTYDCYSWMKCGQHTIPVGGCQVIYYKCPHANCGAKKSVALSADGHILETVFRGSHNHSRRSEWWLGDGPAGPGFRPGSQDYVFPEVSAAGTSMPRAGQQQDHQLPTSSESEDDEATERHMQAPAERITVEARGVNSLRNERRRSKSKVWDEFTAVLEGAKIHSAECKHCKKWLSGKSSGGTSHLRRHLKICPAQPGTVRVQQQQSSSHPDTSIKKHLEVDQDKSLEFLTKALVSNLCSFSLASSANFREFMAAISPTYDVVSQGSVEEKFLGIFQHEKLKLKEKIALTPGGVLLAIGDWNLDFKRFICVTVHFIDENWRLNRKIIKCCYSGNRFFDDDRHYFGMFPNWASYSRMVYGREKSIIKEAVQDWSLEQKLLGIALPNSVDNAAILNLEENLTGQNYLLAKWRLLTLPCMIGLLHNLIEWHDTKEFMDKTSQSWFEYMTCSPRRTNKYKEILSQLHLNKPSFSSRNWYFTYYLLEAALMFNKALPNPGQLDSISYWSKPSCEQLTAAENFCDVARPIYHAVKVISSHHYETLNSYFHAIWSLKIALMNLLRKANIGQVFDVEKMQERFDELWRKWYLWLSLAVVLDPRYKICFLDSCFKLAFGSDARSYILQVRGKLYELFLQYSCDVDQQSGEHLNQRSDDDLQFDGHGRLPVHDTSQIYIEQSAHEELGELTAYLEGDVIPQNVPLDILNWWKDHASTYPAVARLARDILAIPGSAISAESAFDEIDERASLFDKKNSPEAVEALICTHDWIKS